MDIVEELRQNRDSGAKRLVSEYKAGLMSLARRFCVNETDAEELVNATLAKVVASIDDYLEQSAFFAWMCQILTNLHRDSVRRKSSKMVTFSGDIPELSDESAQEEIFRNLDHSLLRDAIKELPDDQRELLLLHYFMDMPVAKIAKFLSIPNGTVFSRLHYARKALAAKLGVKLGSVAKTPGGKALLVALALCGLTALGAGVYRLGWGEPSRRAAVATMPPAPQADATTSPSPSDGEVPTPDSPGSPGSSETIGKAEFQSSSFDSSTHEQPAQENTMKMPTLRSAATLLATSSLALVPLARGAAEYSTENDGATLVVTVGLGETATLDATQVTSSITNIVKRGTGTLVASAIGSYTGDFDIEAGIWQCKVAGDFGKTSTSASAGTVHVRDGASIECVSTEANPGMLEGKTVHLYGAAADGTSGKIVLSASTTMGWKGFGKEMTVVLHNDATFSSAKRFTMYGTFDLGGHVLSLAGRQQFDLGGTVTNGGSVVVKGSTTLMVQQDPLVFAADSAATGLVRVESSATLNMKTDGVAANGWMLQNDGGSLTCNAVKWPTDTTIGVWDGPVVLSGSAKVANYGAHNSANAGQYNVTNTVFNLTGAISGTSGSLAIGPGWLNLHGPAANTYTRAVTVRGKSSNQIPNGQNAQPVLSGSGGIGVWNGASVFPDASSITLNDSARIEFMDDTASTVGALRFVGDTSTFTGDPGDDTQSIKGGSATARPNIAGLTKTGTNTLVVASPARFTGPAAISNGTLRIAKNYQFGNAGLNETHYVPTTGTYNWLFNQDYKPAAYAGPRADSRYNDTRTAITDNGTIETGPRRCCSADGWTSYSGMCQGYLYTGYVWNRTGAEATWQVLADNEHHVYVYFGEKNAGTELVFVNSSSEKAQPREVTLPAGPTKICIWIVATENGGTAKPYNYDKRGLMYATNPNVAVADFDPENPDLSAFRQMADSGAGELFTIDTQSPEAFSAEFRMGRQPVFSSLAFTHGATLDLDGNGEFYVKDLAGSPEVVNAGTFNVTNNWTILAADFPKDDETVRHPLTVDGALAFADGATFSIDDRRAIERDENGIVVATATGGITGLPVPVAPDCPVKLVAHGNELILRRAALPLVIVVR